MTAEGKINASNVQTGHRIIVKIGSKVYTGDTCFPSSTKTGEGVVVTTVIEKKKAIGSRGYIVTTGAGQFYAEPIQTMWLAPEDNAGIKRALAEAKLEDRARLIAKTETREVERAEIQAQHEAAAQDEQCWTNGAIIDVEVEAHREDTERTTVAHPEGTPEHEAYASRLQAALAAPGAWDEILGQSADQLLNGFFEAPAEPVVTVTGAIVNPRAMETFNEAHRRAGDLATALGLLHLAARLEDKERAMMRDADAVTQAAWDRSKAKDLEDRKSRTGGDVVRLLEKVWNRIREDHPELPDVVIVTGSGLTSGSSKWGHFRPDGWTVRGFDHQETVNRIQTGRHELFLAGEALAKGSVQTLQTMLHEAAHTLARVRDVKDTSRQGRWHNQEFRKLAVEVGLEHRSDTADKAHGYSFVTLTKATRDRYADLLAELDREIGLTCHLPSWLGGDGQDEGGEKITGKPKTTGGEPSRTNIKLTCRCDEPNIVRASRKIADKSILRCEDCKSLFLERG